MNVEKLSINVPLFKLTPNLRGWIKEAKNQCQNYDSVVKRTTVLLFTEVMKGGHNE